MCDICEERPVCGDSDFCDRCRALHARYARMEDEQIVETRDRALRQLRTLVYAIEGRDAGRKVPIR